VTARRRRAIGVSSLAAVLLVGCVWWGRFSTTGGAVMSSPGVGKDPEIHVAPTASRDPDEVIADLYKRQEELMGRPFDAKGYSGVQAAAIRELEIIASAGPMSVRSKALEYVLVTRSNLANFEESWNSHAALAREFVAKLVSERADAIGAGGVQFLGALFAAADPSPERVALLTKLTLDPFTVDVQRSAHLWLGRALAASGDLEVALEQYSMVTRTWPESRESGEAIEFAKNISSLSVGHPFPFEELAGAKGFERDRFGGKWGWIEISSVSCGWCRAEAEDVASLSAALARAGVVVTTVRIAEEHGTSRFASDDRATWPVIEVAQGDDTFRGLGVGGLPSSFAIDPNGVIKARGLRGLKACEFWRQHVSGLTDGK
jgi:hypothetical protein